MQEVTVTGVEEGALVVSTAAGERFRLVVDDVLHSSVRRIRSGAPATPRLSPREVQAQIRAGLSAEDVAELTGAALDDVRRYAGPVLAEREHIVASALSVPVVSAAELSDADDATFGAAIRARLGAVGAGDERWSSWRDAKLGWVVKLEFEAGRVDHDARWLFDAKRQSLSPHNAEAATLSKPGSGPDAMVPRLRAVGDEPARPTAFDANAFVEDPSESEPVQPQGSLPKAARAAMNRSSDDADRPVHQTADLLEALRRRRGEREAAPADSPPAESRPEPIRPAAAPTVQTFTPPPAAAADSDDAEAADEAPEQPRPQRRGRAAMPSWDEIVFGAKSDD